MLKHRIYFNYKPEIWFQQYCLFPKTLSTQYLNIATFISYFWYNSKFNLINLWSCTKTSKSRGKRKGFVANINKKFPKKLWNRQFHNTQNLDEPKSSILNTWIKDYLKEFFFLFNVILGCVSNVHYFSPSLMIVKTFKQESTTKCRMFFFPV